MAKDKDIIAVCISKDHTKHVTFFVPNNDATTIRVLKSAAENALKKNKNKVGCTLLIDFKTKNIKFI